MQYLRFIICNVLFVFFFGCEDVLSKKDNVVDIELELYMNEDITNGIYQLNYQSNKSHSYTSVSYQISPPQMARVFWFSPDSFTIYHQGFPITEPIINYSTYSREDGTGKQNIYLNREMIGKTLTIIGCLNQENCKELYFTLY